MGVIRHIFIEAGIPLELNMGFNLCAVGHEIFFELILDNERNNHNLALWREKGKNKDKESDRGSVKGIHLFVCER